MSAELQTSDIRHYTAVDSGLSRAEVLKDINANAYQAYGPGDMYGPRARGLFVDPLLHYRQLLDALVADPRIRVLPFVDALPGPVPADEIWCALRHDIDFDLTTACCLAKLEHELGLRSTFYVLHTAPYYGQFVNGTFLRNESMIDVYREIQALGHEIALHTDPFLVYQTHQIDGAEALTTEIAWLRNNGIEIVGTTAHNSVSVYGAANYAIFAGRQRSLFELPGDEPCEIVHEGKWSPLGVLSEAELGLRYEANEMFWQEASPVRYGVTWGGVNTWWWEDEKSLTFRKRLGAAAHGGELMDTADLFERIAATDLGSYLCLVVHPVYYGLRHSPDSGPQEQVQCESVSVNHTLGWETYVPKSLQAEAGAVDGKQEYQSINLANDIGMTDLAKPVPDADCAVVALLGGENIDGPTCCAAGQLGPLLEERLQEDDQPKVQVRKLAYPGMGFTRLYSWYRNLRSEYHPKVVVIGIGANEPEVSIADRWSLSSGFSTRFPPGDYLHWDDGVQIVEASQSAEIRRRSPREQPLRLTLFTKADGWPAEMPRDLGLEYLSQCLAFMIEDIRNHGSAPLLMVQDCGEDAGLLDGNTSIDTLRELVDQLDATLTEVLDGLDVPQINPYRRLIEESKHGRQCWWSAKAAWNYRGQKVAVESAAEKISVLLDAGLDHEEIHRQPC